MQHTKYKIIIFKFLALSALGLFALNSFGQLATDRQSFLRALRLAETNISEEAAVINEYQRNRQDLMYGLGRPLAAASEFFAGEYFGVEQIRGDVREMRALLARTRLLFEQGDMPRARASLSLLQARRTLNARRIYNFLQNTQAGADRLYQSGILAETVLGGAAALLFPPTAPAGVAAIVHAAPAFWGNVYSDLPSERLDLLNDNSLQSGPTPAAASASETANTAPSSQPSAAAPTSAASGQTPPAGNTNLDPADVEWQNYRALIRREQQNFQRLVQAARNTRVSVRSVQQLAEATLAFRNEWHSAGVPPSDFVDLLLESDAALSPRPPLVSQYRAAQMAWQERVRAGNLALEASSSQEPLDRIRIFREALLRRPQNRNRRSSPHSRTIPRNPNATFMECLLGNATNENCENQMLMAGLANLRLPLPNHKQLSLIESASGSAHHNAALWNEVGGTRESILREVPLTQMQGQAFHPALLAHDLLLKFTARGAVLEPAPTPADRLNLELRPINPAVLAAQNVDAAFPASQFHELEARMTRTTTRMTQIETPLIPRLQVNEVVPRLPVGGVTHPRNLTPEQVLQVAQRSAGYSTSDDAQPAAAPENRRILSPEAVLAHAQNAVAIGDELTLSRLFQLFSFLSSMSTETQNQMLRLLTSVTEAQRELISRAFNTLPREQIAQALRLVSRLPSDQVLSAINALRQIPVERLSETLNTLSRVPEQNINQVMSAISRASPEVLQRALTSALARQRRETGEATPASTTTRSTPAPEIIYSETNAATGQVEQRAYPINDPAHRNFNRGNNRSLRRLLMNVAGNLPRDLPETFEAAAGFFGFFGFFETGPATETNDNPEVNFEHSLRNKIHRNFVQTHSYYSQHENELATLAQANIFEPGISSETFSLRLSQFMTQELDTIQREALVQGHDDPVSIPESFQNECAQNYQSAMNVLVYRYMTTRDGFRSLSEWETSEHNIFSRLSREDQNVIANNILRFSESCGPVTHRTRTRLTCLFNPSTVNHDPASIGASVIVDTRPDAVPQSNLTQYVYQGPGVRDVLNRLCESDPRNLALQREARHLVATNSAPLEIRTMHLSHDPQPGAAETRLLTEWRSAIALEPGPERENRISAFLDSYADVLITDASAPGTENDLIQALTFERPSFENLRKLNLALFRLSGITITGNACDTIPMIRMFTQPEQHLFALTNEECRRLRTRPRLANINAARSRLRELMQQQPLGILNFLAREPENISANIALLNNLADVGDDFQSTSAARLVTSARLDRNAANSGSVRNPVLDAPPHPTATERMSEVNRQDVTVTTGDGPNRASNPAIQAGVASTSLPSTGRVAAANPASNELTSRQSSLTTLALMMANPSQVGIRTPPPQGSRFRAQTQAVLTVNNSSLNVPPQISLPRATSAVAPSTNAPPTSTVSPSNQNLAFFEMPPLPPSQANPGSPHRPGVARGSRSSSAARAPRLTLPERQYIQILLQLNESVPEARLIERRWTPELTHFLVTNARTMSFQITRNNVRALARANPGGIPGPFGLNVSEDFLRLMFMGLGSAGLRTSPGSISNNRIEHFAIFASTLEQMRALIPSLPNSPDAGPSAYASVSQLNEFINVLNRRFSTQSGRPLYLPTLEEDPRRASP